MILDDIDIKILKKFYVLKRKETTNTWKITKELFPICKNVYEQRSKHEFIKKRIKNMDGDLFIITKGNDGRYEYKLIKDNVIFGKHKFPNGYKDTILTFVEDKWMAFQL